MTKNDISFEDGIQKTWIPEGSKEYALFKLKTQENKKLIDVIKKHADIGPDDLILDVGGRDGNVAFEIQRPERVHIIDPDPRIKPLKEPAKFWNEKVQDVKFDNGVKYKLIICCHVLGYLGLQEAQKEMTRKLVSLLDPDGGTLVLFYNANIGYMKELLDYSLHVLPRGHYDYFDEDILRRYRVPGYEIKKLDVSFPLEYPNFEDLARCCWFLFGAIDSDIGEKARRFLPKLQNDLAEPTFVIDERIMFVRRKIENIKLPTIL